MREERGTWVCTYAKTDPSHDTHTLQLLPVLLRNHVLVDGVEAYRARVIVPPKREIQDGDSVRRGQHDIIIQLQNRLDIDANQRFL